MIAGLVMVAAGVSATDVIPLDAAVTGFQISEDEAGVQTLTVTVHELALDPLHIDGEQWAVVRVPGAHNLMEYGRPSLPFLVTEYLLGARDGITLELIDAATREIDLAARGFVGVAPSKGHFNRNVDPESIPWRFDERIYGSDVPFPRADVWVDEPAIAGPLRGQAVRTPVVRWRPASNRLEVVEQARYRVVRLDEAVNPRLGRQPALTGLFDQVARQRAVNYELRYVPFVEAGRLLILAHDDYLDEVAPLAAWETLVGYPTVVTPVSTVGATAAQIQAYIQSLYDAPEGLTWIILVGDYQHIPNAIGANPDRAPCDPCYTKLEGNDHRPDAAISRISALSEAEVTTQVNKILTYEQYPDTGGAGTWYTAGFGVAGDDTGGTGLADWQRMDLLRDDLLEPAYTYTEFDQIYHDHASSSQVTASVNAGKSLGLYIGHGWSGGWSTTGFSSSDANALINDDMLPVIWSVACNNGQFHNVNECFAEAWLRNDSGGAVSFEGATTSESWVPPCNAQRGIIDALRQHVAFTTGGQHVNGKLHCMDIDGDSTSSEGTKFMEQSTLFGSCVMWPRTVEPQIPDEPDDFMVAGGVATLTVTVGGAPLAHANGAIVSFFARDGQSITPLGSGLIDANGVVSATVSGDPTHCHVHGLNLVPQEFELAASADGRVSFDAGTYSCDDTVAVRLADANIPGTSPITVDTVELPVTDGTETHTVTLTEVEADRNIFTGSFVLGSDLQVEHGDTVTVTYVDANDGHGGTGVTKTDTASIDCQGPVISGLDTVATSHSITVRFVTDEPSTTRVVYGQIAPPTTVVEDTALVTEHEITIDGLQPCMVYFLAAGGDDAQGNTTLDDNAGAYYEVPTSGWQVFLAESLDSDPGWQIDNGSHSAMGWAFGVPTGQGQDGYGGPDPTSGYTGPNVYGVNLNGDQPPNLGHDELQLITPVLDLSVATEAQLRFRRWLGVEDDDWDNARIQVSIDGGATWTTAWENGSSHIDDQDWIEQVVELPAGESTVQVRWTMGTTDSSWNFCGWNVDDVVIEGAVPCTPVQVLFGDGFETGDCTVWSNLVGQ
jgi:hypothetical protein